MDEVKLLTIWPSPFGRKVEIALRAKGIAYEILQEQDLKNKKSQLLLESNPVYQKIPVLLHNGRSVCESALIVEYIDGTWPHAPPQLVPDSPYDRYLLRFWGDFLENKIRDIGVKCADSPVSVQEEYAEMWVTLDSALGRGNLMFYDGIKQEKEINYLDACLGSWIPWLEPFEICGGLLVPSSDKCPSLHKWIQSLSQNSIVASTFPAASQMLDYAKGRFHLS